MRMAGSAPAAGRAVVGSFVSRLPFASNLKRTMAWSRSMLPGRRASAQVAQDGQVGDWPARLREKTIVAGIDQAKVGDGRFAPEGDLGGIEFDGRAEGKLDLLLHQPGGAGPSAGRSAAPTSATTARTTRRVSVRSRMRRNRARRLIRGPPDRGRTVLLPSPHRARGEASTPQTGRTPGRGTPGGQS